MVKKLIYFRCLPLIYTNWHILQCKKYSKNKELIYIKLSVL